jgi:mannose-6-phosphate isomerase-like protein (cupin superfamily)
MTTTNQPRIGINAYEEWLEREGIPVHYGLSLNLFHLETRDWPRYGVKGAAAHFAGSGDFCNMFVLEIPAGGTTLQQRHLYEEIYYVLEGRGSTQLEFADGTKRSFEWGPHSFFAIPLNAKHRHFNASGTQRALLEMTTTLPSMLKFFHDEKFIFDLPYEFGERTGRAEYYSGDGDLTMIRPGNNIWETNFVPDLLSIELIPWDDRGPGSTNIMFVLADSVMHAHISEVAPATYKKAHKHQAGTHVLTLSGNGYSLLWDEGKTDYTRVEWEHGVVFPPSQNQFHQHFVTSNNASRYVATGLGGIRYPFTAEYRGINFPAAGSDKQGGSRSVKDGGSQIEFEDQDPRIHEIWLEEMKKNGVEPKLVLPAARP